jgi:hypothetical protein
MDFLRAGAQSTGHSDSPLTGTSVRKENLMERTYPVAQGTEQAVIALWLGHESIETTQIYLDADLELKQRVLDRVTPPAP